ncbi:MAG: preprotein translocase subunit SecE [Pikeienuella sp.]
MINPAQFVAQVRTEGSKVVWPSRKEAGMTTIMVFVMTILVALFFFLVDGILALAIDTLLSL